ncbi:MAG: hypothetical protein PF508_06025 [Spirochaeta sp.]|jgi:hypothetical protein|nr:hypothetical protein [Spirochaeta sp.]
MQVTRLSAQRLKITLDTEADSPLLGIATGVPAGGFPAQKISALARNGGILIRDGRSAPWPVQRLLEHDDELFLCGPFIEGETLEEFLARYPGEDERTAMSAALFDAQGHVVEHESHILVNIGTSLWTADGEILLFEITLAREIDRYLPLERRQVVLFPYLPGRLTSVAEQTTYQAAAILWQVLTGEPLCTGATETERDECHHRIRRTPAVRRLAPETPSPVADELEGMLSAPQEYGAAELQAMGRTIRHSGLADAIDETEAQGRRAEATERYERGQRSTSRQAFFRTRGRTMLLLAVAVLVIASVPFQIIRNHLQAPATAGMAPAELAQTFYAAWREMDHMTMDEILARGVGQDIVREVTNIYVIDRVQMAQTMQQRMAPADEWLAAGMPADKAPYGPIDVDLSVLRRGESEAVVVATYFLWRPAPRDTMGPNDDAGSEPPLYSRANRRDQLTFTPAKWGWEITEMETTFVSPPELLELIDGELEAVTVSPRRD